MNKFMSENASSYLYWGNVYLFYRQEFRAVFQVPDKRQIKRFSRRTEKCKKSDHCEATFGYQLFFFFFTNNSALSIFEYTSNIATIKRNKFLFRLTLFHR